MATPVKMARIYLHEADHGRRHTLLREILEILQSKHCAHGVAAFRGIAGLDETGAVYAANMLRAVVNLPEAVEFYDTAERVEEALTLLQDIVPKGHTVVWDASLR
jgi:PII-like signaling protein